MITPNVLTTINRTLLSEFFRRGIIWGMTDWTASPISVLMQKGYSLRLDCWTILPNIFDVPSRTSRSKSCSRGISFGTPAFPMFSENDLTAWTCTQESGSFCRETRWGIAACPTILLSAYAIRDRKADFWSLFFNRGRRWGMTTISALPICFNASSALSLIMLLSSPNSGTIWGMATFAVSPMLPNVLAAQDWILWFGSLSSGMIWRIAASPLIFPNALTALERTSVSSSGFCRRRRIWGIATLAVAFICPSAKAAPARKFLFGSPSSGKI